MDLKTVFFPTSTGCYDHISHSWEGNLTLWLPILKWEKICISFYSNKEHIIEYTDSSCYNIMNYCLTQALLKYFRCVSFNILNMYGLHFLVLVNAPTVSSFSRDPHMSPETSGSWGSCMNSTLWAMPTPNKYRLCRACLWHVLLICAGGG